MLRHLVQDAHLAQGALAVQRRGGFVGQDHRRLVGKRSDNRHPLLLAARALRWLCLGPTGHVHCAQQLERKPGPGRWVCQRAWAPAPHCRSHQEGAADKAPGTQSRCGFAAGGTRDRGIQRGKPLVQIDRVHLDKVPLVSLLGLVHFGAAFAAAVLGRAGRSDQGGIDGCAVLEQQALGGQRAVARGQYLNAELVLFEQVARTGGFAKAQDAHPIWNALGAQETCKVALQRRLEQSIFHGQVRQAEPLLKEMDAQHGLVCKGWASRAGHR
jgi:hypothetical protein